MIKLKNLLQEVGEAIKGAKKTKIVNYMFKNKANKILSGENKAPHGVIFLDSGNKNTDKKNAVKALVGMAHGLPLLLSKDLYVSIKKIGNKYGYYYEGRGIEPYLNKIKFKSGYDEDANENLTRNDIKGIEPYGIYTLFVDEGRSNTIRDYISWITKKENELKDKKKKNKNIKLLSEMSIFNVIINIDYSPGLKIYQQAYVFKKLAANFSPAEMRKYLTKYLNEAQVMNLANKKCTIQNFYTFWKTTNKNIFGSSKTAKILTDHIGKVREKFVLTNYNGGVFFWGSGHLHSYVESYKYKLIGGEKIGSDLSKKDEKIKLGIQK